MSVLEDRYQPIELLRFTGLFVWLCAAVPMVLMPAWYPEPLGSEQYLAWWILYLVFGFTYWNQVRELPVRTSLPHRVLTLSVLTVTALGVSLMSELSLGGILLLIVGGLLPWMLPFRWAFVWLLAVAIELAMYGWFSDLFGSRPLVVAFHLLCLVVYGVIRVTAGIIERRSASGGAA